LIDHRITIRVFTRVTDISVVDSILYWSFKFRSSVSMVKSIQSKTKLPSNSNWYEQMYSNVLVGLLMNTWFQPPVLKTYYINLSIRQISILSFAIWNLHLAYELIHEQTSAAYTILRYKKVSNPILEQMIVINKL